MKLPALLFLMLSLLVNDVQAQRDEKGDYDIINYPKSLVELANRLDLLPMSGELFEPPIFFGGQGLPFVFGVSKEIDQQTKQFPANVVFWCIKDEQAYLVYAAEKGYSTEFEAVEIISESDIWGREVHVGGTYGMVVYDGVLGIDKELSDFVYVKEPEKKGPEGVKPIPENGFMPIIIYSENSTLILYRYKNSWFKYIERDS